MKIRITPLTTGTLLLPLMVNQTLAQNDETSLALEEIIVTAQKRVQSVQEIPVAIDAFTGDMVSDSGVSDLEDLTQISSSYNINSGAGSSQIFLRGIGSNVIGAGTYSSVAMYVDGAYISRGYSLASGGGSLEGLESLQVLKGPQGSLYGRNATGGALVLTTYTPKPGDEFQGSISGTIGDYGNRKLSASISSGLGDMFAGSLSYAQHDNDGFIENLGNGEDMDDQDGFVAKAKFVFTPTDDIEFVLSASYNEDLQNTLAFQQVGQFSTAGADGVFAELNGPNGYNGLLTNPGLNNPQALYAATVLQFLPALGETPLPRVAQTVLDQAVGIQFSNEVGATFDNHLSAQTLGLIQDGGKSEGKSAGGYYEDTYITLNAKFAFENMDLVSITAYNDHYDSTAAEVFRANPSTLPNLTVLNPANPALAIFSQGNIGFSGEFPSDSIAQELYLVSNNSDIEWITGIYYFGEEGQGLVTGDAFSTTAVAADNDWEVESMSAYAEVVYPFADFWSVTAGARYTDEEYSLDDNFDAVASQNPNDINVGSISRSDSKATYNLKLAYTADNWMVYGGYSSGFKSGSLNANNPAAGRVGPEEIDSFELGFKSDIADGRVRLNGAAFFYDYQNIQLNILEPGEGVTFLVDGAEAEVIGFELELEALVTEQLTLFAATTVLDHEYTTDAEIPASGGNPAVPQFIKGNSLVMTPDAVVVGGLDYKLALNSGAEFAANFSVNHNSGFYIDQLNTYGSGGINDDGFTTANANVKYTDSSDTWSVAVWVNNLTDEDYFRGGVDAAGGLTQVVTAGRPRHYGLTGEFRF